MRTDSAAYAAANQALDKRPRYVINIIFPTGSLYLTSHTGIASVPGTVIEGVVKSPTITSQKIIPDQGSYETGNASFDVVDAATVFTDAIRTKLTTGRGLRGHTVRFYRGFDGMDFTEFALEATQIVSEATYDSGTYSVDCNDITRALRQDLFVRVTTTLTAAVTDTATTIPANDTAHFVRVFHDAAYSDAPSATVGYIKIKDEIIRYAGTDGSGFVGCTRGALGTRPAAYAYDVNTAIDRQEQIAEYVYLEGPVVKVLRAVLTGELYGDSASLPDSWNCGIDPAFVRDSDFTGIGNDLWTPADPEAGVPCRFEGLDKVDGKKFVGQELLTLIGCYSPVYSDGTMGLKRMAHIGPDAAGILVLDESNSVQTGSLTHAMGQLHNHFRIDWNWNGEQFTHRNVFLDANSIAIHGTAEVYAREFKGLHSSRHTDGFIFKMLDMQRDRYAGPPEIMRAQLLHRMNALEVGDVVRVKYATVRDYAGPSGAMDRAFEIQGKSDNGTVLSLDLFGSTAKPSVESPTGTVSALPDAFYTAAGTALSTVTTIAAGHMTAAPSTLTGGSTVDVAGSVYYHAGDLTIDAGVNLQIGANVQLRVMGFLTVNGTINGKGRGHAGVADSGTLIVSVPSGAGSPIIMTTVAGTPGYVGNSRGVDGVQYRAKGRQTGWFHTVGCATAVSRYVTAPVIALTVSGSVLTGLEGIDLRGAGGPPGGRAIHDILNAGIVETNGGTGAAGGAGLCVISRGGAFGVSGAINLDGNDSATTSATSSPSIFPGAGGAGGPGTFYWLIDGGALSVPSLGTTNFSAKSGAVPAQGTPLADRSVIRDDFFPLPASGFTGPISAEDKFNAAQRFQYVPAAETATPDAALPPPTPSALVLEAAPGMISGTVGIPPNLPASVMTRVYESITNNLPDAVQILEASTDGFAVQSAPGVMKYYWVTTYDRDTGRESTFFPDAVTTDHFIAALDTGSGSTLIVRGTAQVDGNSISKPTGVNAWDSDAYSEDGASGGAALTFKFGQNNLNAMAGLNADPVTDSSYTSLDYAWYGYTDGLAYIYESGVLVASSSAYTSSTLFLIIYQGSAVKYYKDGALVRTVEVGAGRTFFFDSSLYSVGAQIRGVSFSALAPINEVKDANVVFLDTFDHQKWETFYRNVGSSSSVVASYPLNGLLGGRVLRAQNQISLVHADKIPYQPETRYRITARVRRIAAGGGAGFEYCYVGVSGYASDGVTPIASDGTNSESNQHYNCLLTYDLSAVALNSWVDATGYFTGNATTNTQGVAPHRDAPKQLYTGVKYFSPLFILNYANGSGTQEIDFIKVERLVVPDDSDNSGKKRLIPDAEFSLTTDTYHWYQQALSGGTTPVISLTGGIVGGKITYTGNGTGNGAIISRRRPAYQASTGEMWTVKIRWRRTGSTYTSGDLWASLYRHNQDPSAASFNFTIPTNGNAMVGGFYLSTAEIAARTVDTWYEESANVLVGEPIASYVGGNMPNLSAYISFAANSGSAIEVDLLDAVPGPSAQYKRVITTHLSLNPYGYAFNEIVCNNSGAATINLGGAPSATQVGVKYYITQINTGTVTIHPANAGDMISKINTTGDRNLAGKGARALVECINASTFVLSGDLA